MNKKILVFHTSFQIQYASYLTNPTKENRLFGRKEPIAILNPEQFPVAFSYTSALKTDFDFEVVIISDNLFGNTEDYNADNLNCHQKKVLDLLRSFIELDQDLYLFYHKRPQFSDTIRPFFEQYFTENLKAKEGFSHLANKESPFYTLVELVNSATTDEYDKALSKLKSFLPSDDIEKKFSIIFEKYRKKENVTEHVKDLNNHFKNQE